MKTGSGGLRRWLAESLQQMWYARSRTFTGPLAPLAPLLQLASRGYALGLERDQLRAKASRRSLPAFVISVGNMVVGGTGKTPFTIWLARHFHTEGLRPAILSRGYGRKAAGVARVELSEGRSMEASRFGDEPVLMARKAWPVPVWVGRERWAAGEAAIEFDKANVLILDDGFQHLRLHRDLDFVLLDGSNPFGNERLLPAGPLREPISHLSRAHAILLTRADDPELVRTTRSLLDKHFPGKPVFTCTHRLSGLTVGSTEAWIPLERLAGLSAVAFSGIAHPEPFFRSLEASSIHLSCHIPFPDHHFYSSQELVQLVKEARARRASFLVTTEKDMARLPEAFQPAVLAARLELDLGPDFEPMCNYLDSLVCSIT